VIETEPVAALAPEPPAGPEPEVTGDVLGVERPFGK
jgi:hypothetical protein